nr:trypsin-like serine protease [Staphylococcus sp. IVB6246]
MGKNLVLTAGHVLYNNNSPRDYMTGGYVIPGKDGDKEPYGRFKIKAMHVPERYEGTPWRKYDMGIIELEPNEKGQSIGDLIPPYRIKQFDRSMIGQKVYSQGYRLIRIQLNKINGMRMVKLFKFKIKEQLNIQCIIQKDSQEGRFY